jgi:hypothetical protein
MTFGLYQRGHIPADFIGAVYNSCPIPKPAGRLVRHFELPGGAMSPAKTWLGTPLPSVNSRSLWFRPPYNAQGCQNLLDVSRLLGCVSIKGTAVWLPSGQSFEIWATTGLDGGMPRRQEPARSWTGQCKFPSNAVQHGLPRFHFHQLTSMGGLRIECPRWMDVWSSCS